MALQGTLDTFALPDVLRLLAATKKSGRLRITADRGSGSVWVAGGAVCAIEATHAPLAVEPVAALFELLRFTEGSFAFDADVAHHSPGPALEVESLVASAEELLGEWREIEAVVPSLDAFATLRRTLDGESVSINQDQWSTLVAVGGGGTVRRIADDLHLAELPVSRALRDLVELGVIDIAAIAPAGSAPAASEPEPEPIEAPSALDLDEPAPIRPPAPPLAEPAASDEPLTDEPLTDEPVTDEDALPAARPLRARRSKAPAPVEDGPSEPERFVPLELPGHLAPRVEADDQAEDEGVADLAAAFPGLANRSTGASADDEELARQLATLSPRAADAVRAAAEAVTDEERDAALDEATEEADGSINRGLLLKFLSSVKS